MLLRDGLFGFTHVFRDRGDIVGLRDHMERKFHGGCSARPTTVRVSSDGFPSACTETLGVSSSGLSGSSTSGTRSSGPLMSSAIAANSGSGALAGARSVSSLCALVSVHTGSSCSSPSSSTPRSCSPTGLRGGLLRPRGVLRTTRRAVPFLCPRMAGPRVRSGFAHFSFRVLLFFVRVVLF